MRETFLAYYYPSWDEVESLWPEALVVPDANLLLDLYRFSDEAQERIRSLLSKAGERLWIPHQFALEYERNRVNTIIEQANAYRATHGTLKKTLEDFAAKSRHPFVGEKEIKHLRRLCEQLNDKAKQQERLLKQDPLHPVISDLFRKRVGSRYEAPDLAKIYTDGAERYAKKIPPGYCDDKKPEPDKYGDFVGWRQIIDHAKGVGGSCVVLITDDTKEDWWRLHKGMALGPRVELLQEFREQCNKQLVLMSSSDLLTFGATHLKEPVSAAVMEEVRARREVQLAASADDKESPEKTRSPVVEKEQADAMNEGENAKMPASEEPKSAGKEEQNLDVGTGGIG